MVVVYHAQDKRKNGDGAREWKVTVSDQVTEP